MLYTNDMTVEVNYKHQEMLRQAEQHRLIRKVKQTTRRTTKPATILNALLTSIRPG